MTWSVLDSCLSRGLCSDSRERIDLQIGPGLTKRTSGLALEGSLSTAKI